MERNNGCEGVELHPFQGCFRLPPVSDAALRRLCQKFPFHSADESNYISSGKVVFGWAAEAGLDAASSILATAKRSIPHSDETGTKPIVVIDVVDVQNVNLIHLIVTFASANQHRAVFPGLALRFPSTRLGA